jgi:hypothetical protein
MTPSEESVNVIARGLVRDHAFQFGLIRLGCYDFRLQTILTLARFMSELVPRKCVTTHHLAGSGLPESLGRTFMGL